MMRIVLCAIGGSMLGAGLSLLVKPGVVKRFSQLVVTGPQRYLWALIAGGFGLLMLWAAPASQAVLFIQVLGGWAMLKGVLLLVLPAAALSRCVGWWLSLPQAAHRVWGLAALAIGLAMLVSVWNPGTVTK